MKYTWNSLFRLLLLKGSHLWFYTCVQSSFSCLGVGLMSTLTHQLHPNSAWVHFLFHTNKVKASLLENPPLTERFGLKHGKLIRALRSERTLWQAQRTEERSACLVFGFVFLPLYKIIVLYNHLKVRTIFFMTLKWALYVYREQFLHNSLSGSLSDADTKNEPLMADWNKRKSSWKIHKETHDWVHNETQVETINEGRQRQEIKAQGTLQRKWLPQQNRKQKPREQRHKRRDVTERQRQENALQSEQEPKLENLRQDRKAKHIRGPKSSLFQKK